MIEVVLSRIVIRETSDQLDQFGVQAADDCRAFLAQLFFGYAKLPLHRPAAAFDHQRND